MFARPTDSSYGEFDFDVGHCALDVNGKSFALRLPHFLPETKTAALDRRVPPRRLRCDRPPRFQRRSNLRLTATLSRSTGRARPLRVPSLVRAFPCTASFSAGAFFPAPLPFSNLCN